MTLLVGTHWSHIFQCLYENGDFFPANVARHLFKVEGFNGFAMQLSLLCLNGCNTKPRTSSQFDFQDFIAKFFDRKRWQIISVAKNWPISRLLYQQSLVEWVF